MSLKRYHTTIRAGRTDVDTIVKLPEGEAKELGLKEYVKGGKTPANKASKPAANKARKPAANKSVEDATDPGASE